MKKKNELTGETAVTDLDLALQRLGAARMLIVGDYILDQYLNGTVSRVSPEAPVPVVHIREKQLKMGGAGNVARNIVALGGKARALTDIGADAGGDLLLSELARHGVETRFIIKSLSRTTSLKTRVVAQNQQMLRYDEETVSPVGEDFRQMIMQNCEEIFSEIDAVILSDYGKGVLTPEIARLVISEAKARNMPVFVDPKGTNYEKYRGADYCTPNLKELREASGADVLSEEADIQKAALNVCRGCGIRNLLVTRSEKGMSLVSGQNGQKIDFPAIAKEVSDVTGAGDSVISIFSMGIATGVKAALCCQLANLAASIVVSKFGAATASIPELEALIRSEARTSASKRRTCAEMKMIAEGLRKKQRKIVFTNGCFDLVHAGHIASFRKAKAMGEVLIVGVNSDMSIRRLKGQSRPIVDLENRLALLEAIEVIDYLVPFEDDTPQALIEAIRPDILVKGKDWEGKEVAGAEFISSYGGRVSFIDLEKGLSTTTLIKKIRGQRS